MHVASSEHKGFFGNELDRRPTFHLLSGLQNDSPIPGVIPPFRGGPVSSIRFSTFRVSSFPCYVPLDHLSPV